MCIDRWVRSDNSKAGELMTQFILPRFGLKQLIGKDAQTIADDISIYVQQKGGNFVIRRHCVEFNIDDKNAVILAILYPFLEVVK